MVYSMILPIRIAHHIILTLIILYWLLKYGVPRSQMLWPVLAVWVSVIISVVSADDKRMAIEFAWHWLTNGALLLMASSWYDQGREREMIKAQIISSAFIAATCVMQAMLYGGRPGGALFNVNLAGGYMAVLLVPTFARLHDAQNIKGITGFLSACLLLFGAVILNMSRGALITAGVSMAVFALLRFNRNWKSLWFPAVILSTLVIGLSLMGGHSAGDVVRMDLWRVATDLIQTHPLGVGVGLFGQAYQALGSTTAIRFTGAHNWYLNLGAEMGAPGLASGAVFLLVFLYGVIGHKRTFQQDASLAALSGIAAHMLVDNFPSQGYTFLASLFVAHVLHEWQPPFTLPRHLGRLAGVAALVGGLMMLTFDRAQISYEHSLKTGSYSSALEATILDPDNRLYQINLSRIAHDGSLEAAYRIDPSIPKSENLLTYGLTNYGRVFQ